MNSHLRVWSLIMMVSLFTMLGTHVAEGGTLKVVKNGSLYANPSKNDRIIGEVKKGMVLESHAQTLMDPGGCWYFVELPNGKAGHVQCSLVEEMAEEGTSPKNK